MIDMYEDYGDEGADALIEALDNIIDDEHVFPWKNLGMLSKLDLAMVPEDLGVYMFKDKEDGAILYVGSATGYRGKIKGLRKRISDYLNCRNINQDIVKRGDEVILFVRPLGITDFSSVFSLIVEMHMIYRYSPVYNKRGLKEHETVVGRACELMSNSLMKI